MKLLGEDRNESLPIGPPGKCRNPEHLNKVHTDSL
jgi:hypothetical protein